MAVNSKEGLSPAGIALIGIVLLALLALTIAIARFHWGAWNLILAMAIATVKLILIALYFMRLRYSGRTLWVFAAAGFFWLLILVGLSLSDYLTRRGPY
ncbi:MAG: caa(3)-type oxidase, subunit [Fibrobacteres bacterium]|nr:caa(3)-type oxidase, subunit [Fibrobacterota bacterium]